MLYSPFGQSGKGHRSHIHLSPLIPLTLLVGCLFIGGCNLPSSSSLSTNNSACQSNCTIGMGTQGVQVFVEPETGSNVITQAIATAKQSVWLEMYLLTDRSVIRALEEAAHRGVDVRVMLEMHPFGGGSPTKTLDLLSAAGVKTKSTSPDFALTHEKSMVLDGSTAYIMTCNFTLSALGKGKSLKNREYGIIDTQPQDVQGVLDIFNADWNRTPASLNDPNLVVSPLNSRNDLTALINNAHVALSIEAEEMQDTAIEQALTNAARRGVQIRVILPAAQSSTSEDSNSSGITAIKQGGIQVKEDRQLYMHAKILVVDKTQAFVGSENISTASLDKNRELGILVSDQQVLATLQQTFQEDWESALPA